MPLPPDFQYSQGSLQDYVDCQRRFELRYLLELAWPAVEVEPAMENERHLLQGARFHRMVHQHLLGVSSERLSNMVGGDEDLARWWRHYLEHQPANLPGQHYPEVTLSAPLAIGSGRRLVATYDLIVVTPEGRGLIFDWKTSRRRSARQWLVQRLQTRVYHYLLVRAGADLKGGQPFQPEQVQMIYWFAEVPQEPEQFAYSAAQYQEDGNYLTALAEEIKARSLEDGSWPLTPFEKRCRFCVYRSLCDRGKQAGSLTEIGNESVAESVADLDLDFEQIAEVEY